MRRYGSAPWHREGLQWRLRVPGHLLLAFLLMGCEAEIVRGLTEEQANQALTSLQSHEISARKFADVGQEGRFVIAVDRTETTRALASLQAEGLPKRPQPGVLEVMREGSLIPSRTAEHARWVAGLSGDLERSLSAVANTTLVRVHLALPQPGPPLAPDEAPRATASVLFESRGEPGLNEDQIRLLVAGAVPGLSPDAVAVVQRQRSSPPAKPLALSQVGPVQVSPSSAPLLKGILAGLLCFNLVLLGVIGWLWQRSRTRNPPAPIEPKPLLEEAALGNTTAT